MKKSRLLSFLLIVILICILSIFLISCSENSDTDVCTVNIYIGDYLYSTTQVDKGSKLSMPNIEEYEGIKILYWYTDNNNIVFPYKVTGSVDIYAELEKSITVEFYSDNTRLSNKVYSSTAFVSILSLFSSFFAGFWPETYFLINCLNFL